MKPLGTGSPGKARSIDTVVTGGPGLRWRCLAAALLGAGLAGAPAAPVPACAGTAASTSASTGTRTSSGTRRAFTWGTCIRSALSAGAAGDAPGRRVRG